MAVCQASCGTVQEANQACFIDVEEESCKLSLLGVPGLGLGVPIVQVTAASTLSELFLETC